MTIVAQSHTLPNGQRFRNRLAKAAMTEGLAGRDGLPNAAHEALYRRWAAGGCGLLITGNVQVDRGHLERPGNVIVDGPLTPDAKAAWARWAARWCRRWCAGSTPQGEQFSLRTMCAASFCPMFKQASQAFAGVLN
jgi:2,4-dienoyl-CoA reductase-like NADH-dependent reductase (Old Yellow Enzyme family)